MLYIVKMLYYKSKFDYNMSLIRDERYHYQYTLPNKTLFFKYVLTNESENI